jgi:uncharacterized protein (DUF1697 family)
MKTYIALLKGINVGGHKKVSMAELRILLAKSGFQNVQTYIQSGNVIFKSVDQTYNIEVKISNLISVHFGFDVSVIVKTNPELQLIFDSCPFENAKKEKSYFIMLNKVPERNLIEKADKIFYDDEEIIIKNNCLYFYCSKGYGQSKFNMNTYERKLNVIGTSRNYNTMVKLLSLSTD